MSIPATNITSRNISPGVLERVFKQEKFAPEAAYYHQSSTSAFMWGLFHLDQEDPEQERELKKTEEVKYIAQCLKDRVITVIKENKIDTERETEIISSKDIKIYFCSFKESGTESKYSYKIIKKEYGLFLNREEILYEFEGSSDFIEELKIQCDYILSEDYIPNCFGYNMDPKNLHVVNSTDTPLPADTPFLIFNATLCDVDETERKEEEEKHIYIFKGSDLFGNIDMQPIYNKIDELINKGKKEFIIHGFSRGCYTALAVSRKYSTCKFYAYLIDPMKGPFKQAILESNIIPKNVRIANIAYGGKYFLGHLGYRAILSCQSVHTKVNIVYDKRLGHNNLCALGRADGTSRYGSEAWKTWDPRIGYFPKQLTYGSNEDSDFYINTTIHGPSQNILNKTLGNIKNKYENNE